MLMLNDFVTGYIAMQEGSFPCTRVVVDIRKGASE